MPARRRADVEYLDGHHSGQRYVAQRRPQPHRHPWAGGRRRFLNIQGGITFDANSQPIFSLSPTYNGANDKVVVHNGVNGGGVQVGISCGATLDTTHDYVLFSSTAGITGNFNPTPIWMATTPAYASQYSIITSGTEVHLHYIPVLAAFFDSSTSGAAWSTGSANWSTSSGGGGTLAPWGNSDYAYFYASDITPGAMNVSVGSAGVTAERITLQGGGGNLNINNNTVTLAGGPNLTGYCLLRNETANNMVFNSVIAGPAGLYMGYSMGSGSIVLGANNTYAGGTLVGNGRLVIQNGANATGSGDVQVTNDPNNASYVGALTWNTATATIAGNVSLSSASPSLIARLGPSSGVSALQIGGNLGFGANSKPDLRLEPALPAAPTTRWPWAPSSAAAAFRWAFNAGPRWIQRRITCCSPQARSRPTSMPRLSGRQPHPNTPAIHHHYLRTRRCTSTSTPTCLAAKPTGSQASPTTTMGRSPFRSLARRRRSITCWQAPMRRRP